MSELDSKAEQIREKQISRFENGHFDALVIGGGINGAVAALALRSH